MSLHLLSCLGRERRLCAAELAAVLQRHSSRPRFQRPPGELAWVEVEGTPHWPSLQDELGGTVKLAEALPCDPASLNEAVDEWVDDFMRGEHEGGRLEFGISVYRLDPGSEPASAALAGCRRELERRIKQRHTAEGGRARFVASGEREETALSSAQVAANQLVQRGLELVVGVDRAGHAAVVGRTRSVQPIEAFVEQDAARSHERFRQGTLPQKLARILVNLARTASSGTLLDPFCGIGSIAGQALLLGLTPIATDRDAEAVQATAEYLDRLRALRPGLPAPRVERVDVRRLSQHIEPLSVDMVACEPDLGPPLRSRPTPEKAVALANACRELYIEALAEVRTVLRPGGRVAWICPAWDCGSTVVRTRLARELYLLGFVPARPCAAWGEPHTTLAYHRPGQYVRRMVHILQN